ncbi:MAG: RNA-directed DNA polymerase [Cytophagaceae bacterium]|nr:RNA-directed DNA polymerase [Cytophagaceae bacterium]
MITIEKIKEAYYKLKAFVYYDSSDLFLRNKLALFECGIEGDSFDKSSIQNLSSFTINEKLNEKLNELAFEILNHHDQNFIHEKYLDRIKVFYLPKKFDKGSASDNFLTNKRISKSYHLNKVTVFADFPIELHLIGILWLMEFGYKLDRKLDDSCVGNRLILNKDKEKRIVGGSALFKPYFVQYQKWRDTAVKTAKELLENGSDIAFINLDIKDYFYSARFNFDEIEKVIFDKQSSSQGIDNLHDIFKKIHEMYTQKIKELEYPDKSIDNIRNGQNVLPIGFASSYVLANFYLHDFDKRLKRTIPNSYFGRYVDDIIIVLKDPCIDPDNICSEVDFSFLNT